MMPLVLSPRHHLKVIQEVIRFYLVFVVDLNTGRQIVPEVAFHNQTVLSYEAEGIRLPVTRAQLKDISAMNYAMPTRIGVQHGLR